MTFTEMAQSVFGYHLTEEQISKLAAALCNGYCEGLKFSAWRHGGIHYIGESTQPVRLSQAILEVQEKFGPL